MPDCSLCCSERVPCTHFPCGNRACQEQFPICETCLCRIQPRRESMASPILFHCPFCRRPAEDFDHGAVDLEGAKTEWQTYILTQWIPSQSVRPDSPVAQSAASGARAGLTGTLSSRVEQRCAGCGEDLDLDMAFYLSGCNPGILHCMCVACYAETRIVNGAHLCPFCDPPV